VVPLHDSDVHIWYRPTTSLDSEAARSANQHLSIEERTRRNRFRFEVDSRDFTIAHDLLRRTLSRYGHLPPADWQFARNEYGKPSINSIDPKLQALSFSLSHTRGFVACAITLNTSVGIDVERTDQSPRVQEIADRYFSSTEAAWLRQSPDELRISRFVELWTLKEAFLKANGVGLFGFPTDVSIQFDEDGGIAVAGPSTFTPNEWHFALFEPVHNVRLGIMVRGVVRPRVFIRQDEDDGCAHAPIRVSAGI
jgi:4'-phosphopantetheinyl transferase